jgi:hypothetical protein
MPNHPQFKLASLATSNESVIGAELKDLLVKLNAMKADVVNRLLDVERTTAGAQLAAAVSSAGVNYGMNPFARLILPLINSLNPANRQTEVELVLAMCAGAQSELVKELAAFDAIIGQLINVIREHTAPLTAPFPIRT